MKYQIDEDILNKTDKCCDYFSCLFGKDTCLCEVEKQNGATFIQPVLPIDKSRVCQYMMSFGFSSYLCICPTRKEIYKHYNV